MWDWRAASYKQVCAVSARRNSQDSAQRDGDFELLSSAAMLTTKQQLKSNTRFQHDRRGDKRRQVRARFWNDKREDKKSGKTGAVQVQVKTISERLKMQLT